MAKRQVFFSFHYNRDSWRASQVRNMGKVDGNSTFSDNDWEEVRYKYNLYTPINICCIRNMMFFFLIVRLMLMNFYNLRFYLISKERLYILIG